jgi:hypothetical protein
MKTRCLFLTLLTLLALPAPVPACNIPVFRYALERWRADRDDDAYQVFIFHRGPLSDTDRKVVESLRQFGEGERALAHLRVETVDLAGEVPAPLNRLWQAQVKPSLPWVVARYPGRPPDELPAWSGPLTAANAQAFMDSPARREVARRILKGDAVVWVLLEIGDAKKDAAAEKILQTELKRLEKEIRLPDGVGEGSVRLLSELPVKVAFSVLRVSRTAPAERVFVEMLLHTEKDLETFTEPIVFPIFGRGRALDALIGKGINPDTIQDAAAFLCGACSCQVKQANPGVDLLVAADWDSILDDRRNPGADTPGSPDLLSSVGKPVPIPSKPAPKADVPPAPSPPQSPCLEPPPVLSGSRLWVALAATGCLVLVTGALAVRSSRQRNPGSEP